MDVLTMMKEGGPLAMAAVALGVIGAMVGMLAVVLSFSAQKSGFGFGLLALVLGIGAAGAGVGGTLFGHVQLERAIAMVDPVDAELIRKAGWREAASASHLGFYAGLLPLLLGGLAAVLGARLGDGGRRQGLEAVTSSDGASGRVVAAMAFGALAALGVCGAWVVGHRPAPPSKYEFDVEDHEAWDLARGISYVGSGAPSGCQRLDEALQPYFTPSQTLDAPVSKKPIPASLAGWRAAADRCVGDWLTKLQTADPDPALLFSPEGMLRSPMLHDPQLRAAVLARVKGDEGLGQSTPEVRSALRALFGGTLDGGVDPALGAALGGVGPGSGATERSRDGIRRAFQGISSKVRQCYERALVKNPKLAGKVSVSLTIEPSGKVSAVHAVDSLEPTVDACVVKLVERLVFERAEGKTVVTFPFIFKAAE
ncbi:MAG: AgmX/PglI C-terminal domain-containing protein [Myxococcaceae bacterium]